MVHVRALPGTPHASMSLMEIADIAADEARQLVNAGFDSIIIENMHDRPYLRRAVGPEIVAGMTCVGHAVRDVTGDSVPLGVQILAGANEAALAVAHTINAAFIRAEGFVFAGVADEGILDEADAGPLLRYRRSIGAASIAILADIKKKHSAHAMTADVSLAETARAAAFCGADAVIVTGTATGEATAPDDVRDVADAVEIPVAVGSGVTPDQIPSILPLADALIVGSACKVDGLWSNPLDPERVKQMVAAVRAAR